jgi:hypothetical protein
MARPSKRACFLVYLAVQEQDIVDENYADTDSDEKQNDIRLQDLNDNENDDNHDNNEEADWRGKLPADQASVHKFIEEQNGLKKKLHQIL